jgi:gas vesicle protein
MTDYERFGDYQPSDRGTLSVALTFLFVGLGIGTAVALLIAPKSGRQLRRNLRRKYEDARDVFDDWSDQAGGVIERGTEWANIARDRAKDAKERVAPFARAAAKRAKEYAR